MYGGCNQPMAPVVRAGDRFDYLCPPSCGHDQISVQKADDEVFEALVSHYGWNPRFCSANPRKRNDIVAAGVQRVDLCPDGSLSITYTEIPQQCFGMAA